MMIIVALLTTNVTAYAFSQISEIVREEDIKKKSLSKMLNGINLQMQLGGLGMNMQQKVRRYFQYLYYRDKQKLNIQEKLIEKLPYNLKEEVLYDLNKEFINDAQIFQDLSPQCQKYISLSIKQKQLLPDEVLIQEQQTNDCLYYVTLGTLEISCLQGEKQQELIDRKNYQRLKSQMIIQGIYLKPFSFKQKKQTFGYEGFLFGENSPYSIKSNGLSVVSYIENNSLLQILKQFPVDYVNCILLLNESIKHFYFQEKYCFIKDKAIYGNLFQRNFKLNCLSCQQSDHSIKQCPYLSISVKYRQQKSSNDRLSDYKRSNKRCMNSLYKIEYIQQRAMEALVNNDESVFMDALYVYNNTEITEQDDDQESTNSSKSSLINTKKLQNQILSKLDNESKNISSQTNFEINQTKKQTINQQSNQSIDQEANEILKISCNNLKDDFDNSNSEIKSPNFEKYKDLQIQKFNSVDSPFEQKNVKFLLKKNSPHSSSFNEECQSKEQNPNDVLKKYFEKSNATKQKTHKTSQSQLDKSTSSYLKTQETPELKLLKQTFEQRQRMAQTRIKQAEKQINDRMQIQKQLTTHQFVPESPIVQTRKRATTICENPQCSPSNNNQSLSMISMLTSKNQPNLSRIKKIQMSKEIIRQKLEKNQNQNNPTLFQAEELQQNHLTYANSFNHITSTQFVSSSREKVTQIYEESSEYQIRCKINLQDIDKLVVRKQFQLQQQQNLIENFIEVPDNELDIDQIKTYQYYFKRHNIKVILQKIKMIQDQKLNSVLIQKKNKKLSFKKSQNNILLNFKQNLKRNSSKTQSQTNIQNSQSFQNIITQSSHIQIMQQNQTQQKQEYIQ